MPVLVLGLVAGTIAGVVGTGSSIILIPALVLQFGPQQSCGTVNPGDRGR